MREGHLKIIDFGTAKDLVEVDLNGPEFVGTPEYMSPSTVRSKPKVLQTGPAVDLSVHCQHIYIFRSSCVFLGYIKAETFKKNR